MELIIILESAQISLVRFFNTYTTTLAHLHKEWCKSRCREEVILQWQTVSLHLCSRVTGTNIWLTPAFTCQVIMVAFLPIGWSQLKGLGIQQEIHHFMFVLMSAESDQSNRFQGSMIMIYHQKRNVSTEMTWWMYHILLPHYIRLVRNPSHYTTNSIFRGVACTAFLYNYRFHKPQISH